VHKSRRREKQRKEKGKRKRKKGHRNDLNAIVECSVWSPNNLTRVARRANGQITC